jgi:hypothetical protein
MSCSAQKAAAVNDCPFYHTRLRVGHQEEEVVKRCLVRLLIERDLLARDHDQSCEAFEAENGQEIHYALSLS